MFFPELFDFDLNNLCLTLLTTTPIKLHIWV
jgi:hypothetical protein